MGRIADFPDRMRRDRPRLEAMPEVRGFLVHERQATEHLPGPDLRNPRQEPPLGDRPRFEGLYRWGILRC